MSLASTNPFAHLEAERGGRNQRAKKPRLLEQRSFLAEHLLERWGDNAIHATEVQEYAWVGCQDILVSGGNPPAALVRLAKLGTTGEHKSNIKKQLEDYVAGKIEIIQPDMHDIPLKLFTGEKIGPQMLPHAYVPTHVWLAYLYANYRGDFERRLLGPPGRLEKFWDSVAANDPRRDHPLFLRPDYRTNCVPLILYGDGVPCTTRDSLQGVGVESLLTDILDVLARLIFISGYFLNTAVTPKDKFASLTKDHFWQPIIKFLLICETGEWPPGSAKSGPMFGGKWLSVFHSKSDYEWSINCYNLPGHWGSHDPCCKCPADTAKDRHGNAAKTSMFYFLPDMVWLAQVFISYAAWIKHCAKKGKKPVAIFAKRAAGGLGLACWYIFYDPLHSVCLGVTLHLLGSVLWLFCYTNMLGRQSPEEKLQLVWTQVMKEYKPEHSSRITSPNLKQFVDPKKPRIAYPVFKAKAAEARYLVPIMHTVWLRLCPRTGPNRDDLHLHIAMCLQHLAEFYKCLNYKDADGWHPYRLPDEVLRSLRSAVGNFLIHYSHVAQGYAKKKLLLFNLTSKFHQLYHIGHDAQLLNPRYMWAYHNEAWIGAISLLGESRGFGRPAALRSHDICRGWVLGQSIRLHHASLGPRATLPLPRLADTRG